MKEDPPNPWLQLVLCPLLALSVVSCNTTTRLGSVLVPAHPNSYQTKNEKVEMSFERIGNFPGDAPAGGADGDRSLALGADAIIGWAANQAVKKVSEELKAEAKKYQQQWGKKSRETRSPGVYAVALTRTVDDLRGQPQNACQVDMELGLSKDGVGYLDLTGVHVKYSKAKIVAFNWNPVQWVTALLLETGEVVEVQVHAKITAFDSKGARVTLLDDNLSPSPMKFNLRTGVGGQSVQGDWFGTANLKHFSMEIRVTETDPSNVKKVIEDAAGTVEKEGPGFLSGVLGG